MEINMQTLAQSSFDMFTLFDKRWALLTAGDGESWNTMTISWGMMGTLWNKPMVQVFVRGSRKTYTLMQHSDIFTVSFFPETFRKDLSLLGRVSGYDNPQKVQDTALTPVVLEKGVGFKEATLTFVCKKLYTQPMDGNAMPKEIADTMYSKGNAMHTVFIGEIIGAGGITEE